MKIAVYNIENLFYRDKALIKRSFNESINLWLEEFEELISRPSKGGKEISRMRELSFLLGFHKLACEPYAILRKKAGQLYLRKKEVKSEDKAGPWNNWNGWVKVNSHPIDAKAIENKARVIAEADPDILILQEIEDRQSLLNFQEEFLPVCPKFQEIVLVSGNDQNGREIALLMKKEYSLESMRSYGSLWEGTGGFFDKDFQEFRIIGPGKEKILVLTAHLEDPKSDKEVSDQRRNLQSEKLREIYCERRAEGYDSVIVAGTFNAPSFCSSLSPVLQQTDLFDIKRHQGFNVDLDLGKDAGYYSLGAYRMGVNIKQRDYLLLSPKLFYRVQSSGLNRKGIFPGKGGHFNCYSAVDCEQAQASSHPLIWCSII